MSRSVHTHTHKPVHQLHCVAFTLSFISFSLHRLSFLPPSLRPSCVCVCVRACVPYTVYLSSLPPSLPPFTPSLPPGDAGRGRLADEYLPLARAEAVCGWHLLSPARLPGPAGVRHSRQVHCQGGEVYCCGNISVVSLLSIVKDMHCDPLALFSIN